MVVMAKKFINKYSGEFVLPSTHFTRIWHQELSLLKFFPLTCHYSHFLAVTLDFTSFFTMAFLGTAHFLQLSCFGL